MQPPSWRAAIPPMKCLVINLDRSSDRLAHVAAQFDRIGVPFELVAAVEGMSLPDLASMARPANHASKLRMTEGEIACLLSHRECWSRIAAGDDAYVAVFEDDVLVSGNAGALLADASWIPADAGIIKLETFFHKTTVARRRLAVRRGFSASRLHGVHLGSAGYIVSKRAAGALLEATEVISRPVDHVLFNPRFKPPSVEAIYQLRPALCAQEHFIAQGMIRFPSLLVQDREEQLELRGIHRKPKGSSGDRIRREFRRIWQQLADLCRLRRSLIVPFEQYRTRVRPPHTQREKNAL